jgi:hypothetical protein
VASGFEVINTTAKIYQQGNVFVYRQPQPEPRPASYNITNHGVAILGVASLARHNQPPYTPAAADLLADSKQWEAAEGAYCVQTLNSLDVPADGEDWLSPAFELSETEVAYSTGLIMPTLSSLGAIYCPALAYVAPYNMSGAYFTGLSLQSTLVLNFTVIIERFPTNEQGDLLMLARPSPRYDPRAAELYTLALQNMPPGVPAYMNGLGDWFASVVSTIGSAVGAVAGAIPHPIAQAVGAAASTAGAVAKSFVPSPNNRVPAKENHRAEKAAAEASAQMGMPGFPPTPADFAAMLPSQLKQRKRKLKQKRKALKNSTDAKQDARMRKLDQKLLRLQIQLQAKKRR